MANGESCRTSFSKSRFCSFQCSALERIPDVLPPAWSSRRRASLYAWLFRVFRAARPGFGNPSHMCSAVKRLMPQDTGIWQSPLSSCTESPKDPRRITHYAPTDLAQGRWKKLFWITIPGSATLNREDWKRNLVVDITTIIPAKFSQKQVKIGIKLWKIRVSNPITG